MFRSKSTLVLTIPALLLLVAFEVACSSSPEQPILQQLFTASKLRDNTTLANFATVSFDPTKDGIVQDFDVKSVTERTEPLHIADLVKAQQDAIAAEAEFTNRKKEYQDKNLEAIDRVLKAERASTTLRGNDAAVQTEWTKWRDETSMHSKALAEARSKLAAATSVAEVSATTPGESVDVTKYDGDMIIKDVTVDADVKLPSGESAKKTLLITMQQAKLKGEKEITGRWIVTGIKEAAAAM